MLFIISLTTWAHQIFLVINLRNISPKTIDFNKKLSSIFKVIYVYLYTLKYFIELRKIFFRFRKFEEEVFITILLSTIFDIYLIIYHGKDLGSLNIEDSKFYIKNLSNNIIDYCQ